MAKRRTKKDKIIAQLRREVINKNQNSKVEYSLDGASSNEPKRFINKSKKSTTSQNFDLHSLFSYDSKLIKKDLVKTAFFSIAAFTVIIGLSIAWG